MAEERPRKKRWLVWGMAVSIIVLLFSPVMIFRAVNKAAFERKVAQLKAAGYPVSLDDLEAAYVLPEGVENAANVYLEAFKAYVEPNEAEKDFLPTRGKFIPTDDMPPYPPEVIETIRVSLENNRECLELLDKASRMEYCLFPSSQNMKTFNYMFEEVFYINNTQTPLENVFSLLRERNIYLAQTQQAEELAQSTQMSMSLCDCLSPQLGMMEHLMMLSMKCDALSGLEETLSVISFTELQLRLLQLNVRQMLSEDSLASALINERSVCIDFFRSLSVLREVYGYNSFLHRAAIMLYDFSGLKASDSVTAMEIYRKQIDAARLSYSQQAAEFRKLKAELTFHNNIMDYVYKITFGNGYSALANLRVTSQVMCAETVLAVERYRVKYGNLPEGLGELVPEFLAEVYLDPFDGKPLRYVLRAEGGYVIYCIGEDGVDNGGVDMSHKVTGAGGAPEHDWPFTVRR